MRQFLPHNHTIWPKHHPEIHDKVAKQWSKLAEFENGISADANTTPVCLGAPNDMYIVGCTLHKKSIRFPALSTNMAFSVEAKCTHNTWKKCKLSSDSRLKINERCKILKKSTWPMVKLVWLKLWWCVLCGELFYKHWEKIFKGLLHMLRFTCSIRVPAIARVLPGHQGYERSNPRSIIPSC